MATIHCDGALVCACLSKHIQGICAKGCKGILMEKLVYHILSDFKLVFRDNSLRIFLLVPLMIYLVVLFLAPYLISAFEGFERFIPLILMGATMQTGTMYGFIYGIVLIDEKDTGVAKTYGILPVSRMKFVLGRLMPSLLISAVFTFVLLLIQPFYFFDMLDMILVSVLSGMVSPFLALSVSIISRNKMEGMTWFKLVNLLISLPLAALFLPEYRDFFLIVPTHWIFQAIQNMITGSSPIGYLAGGMIFLILLLYLFMLRFSKVHFR